MSSHSYAVTLIPGDGIGPEVTEAAERVVAAAGIKIDWERVEAGAEVIAKYGTPVPDSVLDSIRRNKVALKGPITTPVGHGFQSANVTIRKALDLYACIRPVKSIPGLPSRFEDVNLVVVRENTEGLYEEMIVDNCAMQLVKDPTRFEVLLLDNLYGDIISDLCAGLVGGLGVVPGSNVGDDCAVFEAVHGSAPDIAGKRLANPAAVILSAAEMLRHLGEEGAGHAVTRAVHAALTNPETRTGDLGGTASLDRITDAIIGHLG